MHLSDFDYDLPFDLIAQEPTHKRDESRLLSVDRCTHQCSHWHFADLPQLLPAQCLLVLNDTRVFPARLCGCKESGGRVEILLVRRLTGPGETWQVLCKSGQNLRAGSRLWFAPELWAEWQEGPSNGRGVLQFFPQGDFWSLLARFGEVPLPPYIKRRRGGRREDRERYQTVYARSAGAVAAPTAGLHFTPELLAALHHRGIETVFLTLHVGVGTFQPIRVEQVEAHRMEEEEYALEATAADRINKAKGEGRKVIAVGTTTTRALESAWTQRGDQKRDGRVQAGRRSTALFIYPGYRFRVIDGLITNFHLPRSTLLLLVSAFAGRDLILSAYAEAIAQRYRFYSYGDAMLIV